MKKLLLISLIILASSLLVAEGQSESADNYPPETLDFVAVGSPGGGWDTTVRAVVQTLQQTDLVDANMPVRNNPGASGAKHLAEMQKEKGSSRMLLANSSPLLLNYLSGSSRFSFENTTPLVNLIGDYQVFTVGPDSEFESINEVMDALKKDPSSVSVCGNSTFGSLDHISFLIFAKAAGVTDIKSINYISFEDAAEAQVIGGHVDLLSKGYSEVLGLIDSGDLVPLALTSNEAINGIPSAKEQGIDAFFVNWRGMFGAPDMPDYAVEYWVGVFEKMVKTDEWKAQLEKYNWADVWIPHDEYYSFLSETQENYKGILKELGVLQVQ